MNLKLLIIQISIQMQNPFLQRKDWEGIIYSRQSWRKIYSQRQHLNFLVSKGKCLFLFLNRSQRIKINSENNLAVPESLWMHSWFSESSSRIKSHHKMHKNKCTIITEWEGPRTCQATQTKRLWMKRRLEMAGRPIIIINFHGVLGWIK